MLFSPSDLIHKSILQLKKSKDDGNVWFKSDHLINGGHRLHEFLSILFSVMITHCYNARDLRISLILSIPRHEMLLSTHSLNPSLCGGGCPIIPLLVHQPAYPSIWLAAPSLQRGLSTNPGVKMWCVRGCS